MDLALWVIAPYVAVTVFVVGHIWRWRTDQFGWTTRSSQLLEGRMLRLASPLFHFGLLAVVGGHVVGLVIPAGWTEALGVPEELYHLVALSAGVTAGAAMLTGLALLLFRRLTSARLHWATTTGDKLMFGVLAVVVCGGMAATIGPNLLGGGYDYRSTVAVWFRGVFRLAPDPNLMAGTPWLYQVHALSGLVLLAIWPFTRLVHAWSVPIAYLWRPYLVYRRRSESVSGGRR